jgi:hypothetical protein
VQEHKTRAKHEFDKKLRLKSTDNDELEEKVHDEMQKACMQKYWSDESKYLSLLDERCIF